MWNDNEFNSTFSSPNANAGKEAKKPLPKHVVPVTAHIINMCQQVENESSIYELNHLKFNQICFIGIIRNVIRRANDITYLIDDMTSTEVNVKLSSDEQDPDSDEPRPAQSQFIENQYVKVHGIIKSLQGQKNVQAFNIRPIKELNEITHHNLEVMNASIHYAAKGNCDSMDMQSNTAPSRPFNQQSTGGLTGLHSQISSMIKSCKASEGVHLNEVVQAFPNISKQKLKEALEFLSTDGHVYSTVDDEHFKSTETE